MIGDRSSPHRPILCVEDSDEDFAAISHALRAAGVKNPIERCAHGGMARKALTSEEGCLLADEAALILLDLNLQGVHGSELLADLRQGKGRLAPVIVLSTSSHARDVEICYKAGANAYLVKPPALEDLETMMAAVVKFWIDIATIHEFERP